MEIKTPVLLIDKVKVKSNLERMLQKTVHPSVIFRPHFKTHQSVEVGNLFKEKGVSKITVSSVSMALYFADRGWDDITIAFPLNLLEMNEVNSIAKKVRLNVLIESSYVAKELAKRAHENLGVFIKIDTGYHRTGLSVKQLDEIDAVLQTIRNTALLSFKGFLTHAGHTYTATGKEEILKIKDDAANQMKTLKSRYLASYPDLLLSYGDTPSCSIADNCSDFDEIRPGNFIYYDVMQYHLGSCALHDIAVALACPVVAVHSDRNELVVYGGAVHLSKEFIAADKGFKLFGYVVRLKENGSWSDPINGAYVSSVSQEHGIVKMPKHELKNWKPSDVLGILPIHSCLTANLMKNQTLMID